MNIQSFSSGPLETNAYVISCPGTNHAAIIDPAPESAEPIIQYIEDQHLQPDLIILTHSHWDHFGDLAKIKAKYPIPVGVHSLDEGNLELPGSDGLPCWLPIEGMKPDWLLKEGDVIPIGNLSLKVIHTPGHTPGGVCLYDAKNHVLLSGDTLFKGTIGNLSFPTSQPNLMWKSLKKLSKLPPETQVFPGHGPSTTIGDESWLANAEEIFGF
jgi:hydroxyacylglutathione hydrolase